MRLGTVAGVALACLLLSPPPAHAQDEPQGEDAPNADDERAQTHFTAGRNHYEAGAYEAAIREFETAYELSPRPLLLYNLYLTHERAGNLDEAHDYLERYLDEGEIEPDQRARLETRHDNLEQRIAERDAGQDDPAEDTAGDAAAAPLPPRDDAGGGAPAAAVASLIVGGVGIATFGVFAGLSEAEDQDVADDCGVDAGKTCSSGRVSTLRTYNIVADVALGVGLAAAATGVVLWLVLDDEPERDDVAVAPWVGPRQGGAAARVRF